MYHIRLGLISQAQKISNELKDIVEKGLNRKAMRYHHGLEGAVELENKNYARAIEHFKKAISLFPFQSATFDEHIFFMEPLALAYYSSGDLNKAREEYEKITSLTTGRTIAGNLYAHSFYMMGKICDQLGDSARAVEYYQKFLNLWKDANPGFPEVDDARQRLAGIRSQ